VTGLYFFPPSLRVGLSFALLFGVSSGLCYAPQTPREPGRAERQRLANQYIQEKLPFWQKRLALQDCKISVAMAHPSGLRERTLGNIRWDPDKKTAVIHVMDAADYQTPFRDAVNDMEFTVVHELIHLEMVSLPRSEATHSEEEHVINHLADALLEFDRKDHPAGAFPFASTLDE
jgi:hypothetical protein